jgi:hypothetical protein
MDSGANRAAPGSPVPEAPDEVRRTGPFHVPHRDGTRVEVGEPIHVGGTSRPWMCAVKLVGRKRGEPDGTSPAPPERGRDLDGTSPAPPERGRDLADGDPTQTLLVRMGRGDTPDDARRDALAQLTHVYGTPFEAPPSPLIIQKAEPEPIQESGWLVRFLARIRRA